MNANASPSIPIAMSASTNEKSVTPSVRVVVGLLSSKFVMTQRIGRYP